MKRNTYLQVAKMKKKMVFPQLSSKIAVQLN